MEILKKKVTKHNKHSCHILMKTEYMGKDVLVMTEETFKFIVGRKIKEEEIK